MMIDQETRQQPTQDAQQQTSVASYTFTSSLRSLTKSLGFWFMPGNCVLCKLPSERHRDLCRYCQDDLPWLTNQCVRCGLPRPNTDENLAADFSETHTNLFSGTGFRNTQLAQKPPALAQCLACETKPYFSTITRVIAPLAYDGCARWLVQQQKHRKGAVQGRVLADLLGDAIASHYSLEAQQHRQEMPDLIVPVPLHWRRQLTRGHNQSARLAHTLARRFRPSLNEHLVKRIKVASPQQTLTATKRRTNLTGVFAATSKAKEIIDALPNRRVAIVDDVVTTGATAAALAAALHDAGAQEIHLWSPTRAILRH